MENRIIGTRFSAERRRMASNVDNPLQAAGAARGDDTAAVRRRDARHCVSTRAKSGLLYLTPPQKGGIWVARRFNAGYGMMPPSSERRSPEIFYSLTACGLIRATCTKRGRGFATPGFAVDNHPALKRRATDMSPFQGCGGSRRPQSRGGTRMTQIAQMNVNRHCEGDSPKQSRILLLSGLLPALLRTSQLLAVAMMTRAICVPRSAQAQFLVLSS
jgi:hypothetical protein